MTGASRQERVCRGDDRGVSEVVGFVLMFAVIIASVGLVSTFGFQQLEENRANQELRNAERVMQLVERDYDALQHGEATVRSNEIDANRGQILFTEAGTVGIEVTPDGGGSPFSMTGSDAYQVGAIRYEADDTRIVYQSGMVLRDQGESQTTITPPSIRCSPSQNAAIVSLVTLNTSVEQVSSTVRIVGRTENVSVLYPQDRPGGPRGPQITGISLSVGPEYREAWRRALVEQGNWNNPTAGEFTCPAADRAYVRRTVVDLKVVS